MPAFLSAEDSAPSSFYEPTLPDSLLVPQALFREAFAAAGNAAGNFTFDALYDLSNALASVGSPPIVYGTAVADAYIEVYTVWLQFSESLRSFELIPPAFKSLMLCPEVPRLPQTFGGLHAVWQIRNIDYQKFQKRVSEEEYMRCNFHRILEYAELEKTFRPVRDFYHHPEAITGSILV